MPTTDNGKTENVDLAEVARLVDELDQDLAKLRDGSSNLNNLRGVVEQLRTALHTTHGNQGDLQQSLHGMHALLHKVQNELIGDTLTASDYITRIGRMLGM